jgi:uncharacterized protein (DUF488 family)
VPDGGGRVLELWTIGHSTRPIDAFVGLLHTHRVELLADVRRFAGSRAHPQYHADRLGPALESAGVLYHPMPALGGRRAPTPDAPPTGWRVAGFRGYAEYIQGDEFAAALGELADLAGGVRTAIMCAEAVWWRCHRRIIADVLVSLGAAVHHIGDRGAEPHRLAPPAHLVGGVLSYAPADGGR